MNRLAGCEIDGVFPQDLTYRYGPGDRRSERQGEEIMYIIERAADDLYHICIEPLHRKVEQNLKNIDAMVPIESTSLRRMIG